MLKWLSQFRRAWVERSRSFSPYRLRPVHIRDDGLLLPPSEHVQISHASPVFSEMTASIVPGSLRSSPDNLRIVGDLALTGRLDDLASCLIPGQAGVIPDVTVLLNGSTTPLARLRLEVCKGTDDCSIVRPFPFFARFSSVIQEVQLQSGWNLLTFVATNRHGLSGFAEYSFEVRAIGPHGPARISCGGYSFEPGGVKDGNRSGGGDFYPFLLSVERNAQSGDSIGQVNLNGHEYSMIWHAQHLCLSRPDSAFPQCFLAHFATSSIPLHPVRLREGNWDFADGFGAGLLRSSVQVVDRAAVVGAASWYASADMTPLSVLYRLENLGKKSAIHDRQVIFAQWPTVSRLATIAQGIISDQDEVAIQVLTGDCPEVNHLSAECREAFGAMLEAVQLVAEEARGYAAADVGRLIGMLLNQSLRSIAKRGVSSALKSEILKDTHTEFLANPAIFD